MDLDPRTFLASLSESAEDDTNGPNRCIQLLDTLNQTLTQEQLSSSLLDIYLVHVFDETRGFPSLLSKIMNKKPFKKAVVFVLEILYTVTNNFHGKIQKHVLLIHRMGLKLLNNMNVESTVKVRAMEMLIVSLEKVDMAVENHSQYIETYNMLRNSLQLKKCDSVAEKIYVCLGIFAKRFCFLNIDFLSLRKLFFNQLQNQIATQKSSATTNRSVAGIFEGLTSYCESFPLSLELNEDKAIITKLHSYIYNLTIPQSTIKVANRAALIFLAKNMFLFANLMMAAYQDWHRLLLKWLHYGAEDQKTGTIILKEFYHGIANVLVSSEDNVHNKQIVQYFLDHFKTTLDDPNTTNYEKRSCLRGLRAFSEVCHTKLNPEESSELFIRLMKTFEQMYVQDKNVSMDILEYLPDYLQTVASFMHFKKISNSEVFCLQKGIINMIKIFPKLLHLHQYLVVDTIIFTFYCLKTKDEGMFNKFVANTIYQGVVWTCSHQHVSEAEMLEIENSSEQIMTIKNYLYLWKGLLQIKSAQKYDERNIFLQERKYIFAIIVDKLVRTLLTLISKLNVSIALNEDSLTDIESAYKVVEANDFGIFLNVVDFYQEILDEIEPDILKTCILKLVQFFMMKSNKFPFISGFYKLLSSCLKVCRKLSLFSNPTADTYASQEILHKFLELLLTKMKHFKDDLLIACLQVLLAYPTVIIQSMLSSCTPAFLTVFQIGRKSHKLTEMALDTLEHWQQEISVEDMDPFLKQILPSLDSYLQSKPFNGFTQTATIEKSLKRSRMLKKRKIVMEIEPELNKLQMRILNFIGRQSSQLCEAFVTYEDNVEITVWGKEQHLKLILPYEDMNLELYLDKLLPRVITLALTCSDRKMRIVACEVLQAVVMVFLGNTKQMATSGLNNLNNLLERLAPSLLQLGCDVDQVVQQLFQPLFLQLIHWYTHPYTIKSHSRHRAIIIETILDAIAHPTDSALRDFAGRCVNEYVKWTIKQDTSSNLGMDQINIKVLVNKIRFYSTHPDPMKKIGAALIFNSIYRLLREEPPILNMFWFELLYLFVKSLSLVECTLDNKSAVVQIEHALDHLKRGFIEKQNIFNKPDKMRRIPSEIKGDLLSDIVVWILQQSGSSSPICRKKCIELFRDLVPFTAKYKNLQSFIQDNCQGNWIANTYEAFLVESPECPDKSFTLNWMQGLLCALDGYCFCLKYNLTQNISELVSSCLKFFIETVTLTKPKFSDLETAAILKILEILNLQNSSVLTFFLNENLWNLVRNLIFNPQNLGFDLYYINGTECDVLIVSLENFFKQIPHEKGLELVQYLNLYVTTNFQNVDLTQSVPLQQRNLIKGLLVLQNFNVQYLQLQMFRKGLVEHLFHQLTLNCKDNLLFAEDFPDSTISYCTQILEFAFFNETEIATFAHSLCQPYRVKCSNRDEELHFGIYVLALFEEVTTKCLIENFEIFLGIFFKKPDLMAQTIEIITSTILNMTSNKNMKPFYEYVAKQVQHNWEVFESYFDVHLEQSIDFITHLMLITNAHDEKIKNWLIKLLTHSKFELKHDELNFKIDVLVLLVETLHMDDDDRENLRVGLFCVKNEFFSGNSTISSDLQTRSLRKLLSTMPKVQQSQIFIFFLDIGLNNQEIDLKSCIRKCPLELQKQYLFRAYDFYCQAEKKYQLSLKLYVLFQMCSTSAFESFFIRYGLEILTTLQEVTTELNLARKTLCFQMIEILFARIPISNSDCDVCPVAEAVLPENPTNKKLLFVILKNTLNIFKDELEGQSEAVRLCKCHAYNAMVSIVSNSLKDVNFYTKLFIRQEGSREILWNSLINLNKHYVFSEVFDSYPQRRKILVSIRDELKMSKAEESKLFSVKYIESQRLYNSSLSEDLTKFDFTNTVIRSQALDGSLGEETSAEQSEVELDSVDINEHECMGTVCGLIKHLIKQDFTPIPRENEDYVLSPWMKGVRSLLLNDETHVNVRIFWVKVICNTMDVFRHFGKWFLRPLLKFIVDRCAGDGINYFVTDVISVLVTWSSLTLDADDVSLLYQLLSLLMSKVSNERQDIFKYHLELIKLIVEGWKTSLRIPHEVLFSRLNVNETSKEVEVGIHLSSILLANNLIPWAEGDFKPFCSKLARVLLKSSSKSIYKPCAETLGLALKVAEPHLVEIIERNLKISLTKISTSDIDKYAYSLEAIVSRYPDILDKACLVRILDGLRRATPYIQAAYLRIILSTRLAGSAVEFEWEDWTLYLKSGNFEVQILALEVIYKNLDVIKTTSNFKSLMKCLSSTVARGNSLYRSRVCDIAISLNNAEDEDVNSLIRDILIRGLVDSDREIQEKIFQYWNNSKNLPQTVPNRFEYILSNLYKTALESSFLGYSAYLLLSAVRRDAKPLFEHPLEDCDFEEYCLQTNWRTRHNSLAPMFANTLQTFNESFENQVFNNQLRATQAELTFAPTQNAKVEQLTQFTKTQSSLYVEENDGFVNPNLVELSLKYKVPQRRFLKDKYKIVRHFAHREVQKMTKAKEKRIDSAKERENKITLYRQYRKGDLPDIQISRESILEPLKVMALHDGEISKILFQTIFSGVEQVLLASGTHFQESLSNAVKFIFQNTTQFNGNLLQTLLDIVRLNKKSMILEPDLVARVCQSSGLESVGTLLLEEYLISIDELPGPSKRSRGCQLVDGADYWIKLAELYKDIEEIDIVKTIFLEKLHCADNVQDALVFESQKKWREAQQTYRNLIENIDSLEKKDFYYESYFRCFAHLGEWNSLTETIDAVIPNATETPWQSLWDQGWNQQKILPWYIQGQLKNTLFTKVTPDKFLINMNESLKNPESCEYLESNFAEELCMLWLCQEHLEMAKQYLKFYMDIFLNNWQHLNPMHSNMRMKQSLNLRNVVDIYEFVSVFEGLNVDCKFDELRRLMKSWKNSTNETLPTILLNETRVLYRKQFINLLRKKLESFDMMETGAVLEELTAAELRLDCDLIEAAIQQDNYYMARKYFRKHERSEDSGLRLFLSQLISVKSKMIDDPKKKLLAILDSFDYLVPVLTDSQTMKVQLAAHMQLFNNLNIASEITQQSPELLVSNKIRFEQIIGEISTPSDMARHGAERLTAYLNSQTHEILSKFNSTKNSGICQTAAHAYVQLAYFSKQKNNTKHFISFVLKAMKLNSSEARQLFPCILVGQNLSGEDKTLFSTEASQIPTWMFLSWIPQLLVNIDSPNVAIVSNIIVKIAQEYPQAIVYPYRLSKENFSCNISDEAQVLIEMLDKLLLSNKKFDLFLKALSSVSVPEAILYYYLAKMSKACISGDVDKVKTLQQEVITEVYGTSPDSKNMDSLKGNAFKTIKSFEAEFKGLSRMNSDEVKRTLQASSNKINNLLKNKKISDYPVLLKDYCPWLSNISSKELNIDLEIPGQYDGKRMPLVQYHVKIAGFGPQVSVMNSLRKPIKVTLLGDNSKEYPFLIKFGEDIRQDQRIQQLFTLMNSMFEIENTGVSILTYQVIPLTTKLGIVEWVGNTTSLQEFILNPLKGTPKEKEFWNNFKKYQTWISSVTRSAQQSLVDVYGRVACSYNRDKTIAHYRGLVNSIPWDVLRSSYWKISDNTESFIALRNNFIKSYAAICASHWLLGIGDRHLDNTKICMKNGKALGIDFGHAFGTATQILPVPELVPFRLTPHVINLMEPLGEKGLFREVMVHCLKTLTANKESLLATLNVFIAEPTLDWLEHASRFEDSSPVQGSNNWYPAQKLEQAKRKLKGSNSTSIMIEELKSGIERNQNYLEAYVKLVQGLPEFDIRARFEASGLSVENQVDCLIDHATDYNLLGRMFSGWAAWV